MRRVASLPDANAWFARLIGLQILLFAIAMLNVWSDVRRAPDALAVSDWNEVPTIDLSIGQAETVTPDIPNPVGIPPPATGTPMVPDLVEVAALAAAAQPSPAPELVEALPMPVMAAEPEAPVEQSSLPIPASASGPRPASRSSPHPAVGAAAGSDSASAPSTFNGDGSGCFPMPPYPAEAKRRGLEGTVMLVVEVSASGLPGVPRIESSSGHASLDRAAVTWIRSHWRWAPGANRNFRIPIRYQLR
jgi:protein TonB